jgi:hypothetical protein
MAMAIIGNEYELEEKDLKLEYMPGETEPEPFLLNFVGRGFSVCVSSGQSESQQLQ